MMATTPPPTPTPPKDASERRKLPRFGMALDVTFGPVRRPTDERDERSVGTNRPPEEQLSRTVTVNLSLGGLCLYSNVCYPIGTALFCAVSLPGRTEPMETVGTLVWFHKTERESSGYKLGIEFAQLLSSDAIILQELFEHPPAAELPRAVRVLLVDDDEELRQALQLRLESSGLRVITAANGLEALRKGREEQPHLIILDVMLPTLNGYEVCRLLKFDQKFRHIPVMFLSARCRAEDLELGRAVGADAYVTKPFNGKDLLVKVETLLGAAPR